MTIGIEPFLLYQQTIIYKNPFHDSPNEISINNRTKIPQTTEQKSLKSPKTINYFWRFAIKVVFCGLNSNVMVKYKQRIADRILERKVLGKGAVLIEGPKWCGKTTTAKQLAKSVLDLGDASVLKHWMVSFSIIETAMVLNVT